MKKARILLILLVGVAFNLTGCMSNNSSVNQKDNSTNQNGITATSDTLNAEGNSNISSGNNDQLDKEAFKNNYTPFTAQDSAIYTNLFNINGTSLVFPNWDDNNNISIVNEPYPSSIINTSNVADFFNYPTYTLAVVNNVVYFSDSDNTNNVDSLSSIDLSTRAYTPNLVKGKISRMINSDNILYFINSSKGEKLFSFDPSNNVETSICDDSIGNYLVDGDVILYENKSDKSTLYKINIDGTGKEKLTNFSVNSFAPYSGQILAINSQDNNNLYSIDLKDLSVKRLAIMNGEDLKVFNGQLYFINVDNNRHLSTMSVDLTQTSPTVTFNDISDYSVNEYYPTSKGIFAQKGVNVDNPYIFLAV